MNVVGHQSPELPQLDLEDKQKMDIAKDNSWNYQAEYQLPNSDSFFFRSRQTNKGVFDESEMQLVWQRENENPLIYLVGQGHAGYEEVRILSRSDNQAVWVIALEPNTQNWQVIASLDLLSGQFQSEGVFCFAPPENAWTTIHEKQGILVQESLTWSQDKRSGVQRLYDHYLDFIWERSDQEDWNLKSGTSIDLNYPHPDKPYLMEAPNWATV